MTEPSSAATRLALGVDASPEVALLVSGWWRPATLVQGETELARADGEDAMKAGIAGVLADGRRVAVRLRSGFFSGYRYETAVIEAGAAPRWAAVQVGPPGEPLAAPGRLLLLVAVLQAIGIATNRSGLPWAAIVPAALWVLLIGVLGVRAMRGSARAMLLGGVCAGATFLANLLMPAEDLLSVLLAAKWAVIAIVCIVAALRAEGASPTR